MVILAEGWEVGAGPVPKSPLDGRLQHWNILVWQEYQTSPECARPRGHTWRVEAC